MSNMFANCKSLAVLNLSNFDTKNIENMKDMFSKCYSLTYLNLSNFNSNKLFDISSMFLDCYSLSLLDISNIDYQKNYKMNKMFNGCINLYNKKQLLSNFKYYRIDSSDDEYPNNSHLYNSHSISGNDSDSS